MLARTAWRSPLVSRNAIPIRRATVLIYRLQARSYIHYQPSRNGLYQANSSIQALGVLRCRRWSPQPLSYSRTILTESIPSILTPPLVFVGLIITLWTWKCMMMVLFQDKIIYMPNVPPFARSEKMEDYIAQCKPVVWETEQIKSLDGTKLALCRGSIRHDPVVTGYQTRAAAPKDVVILYFQGNGGSLPPRLPTLSAVLRSVAAQATQQNVNYTLIALSYRGYWTSSGRASQSGIDLDSQALFRYVTEHYARQGAEFILWGQSIGSGVATTLVSRIDNGKPSVRGMVLETPFTSIRSMLAALYPQKWLPYRYLWPFLWNHWDSDAALNRIAADGKKPKILLLTGGRDEVVPPVEAEKLEQICRDLELDYERKDVAGALHNEASIRRDGQQAIAKFLIDMGELDSSTEKLKDQSLASNG